MELPTICSTRSTRGDETARLEWPYRTVACPGRFERPSCGYARVHNSRVNILPREFSSPDFLAYDRAFSWLSRPTPAMDPPGGRSENQESPIARDDRDWANFPRVLLDVRLFGTSLLVPKCEHASVWRKEISARKNCPFVIGSALTRFSPTRKTRQGKPLV